MSKAKRLKETTILVVDDETLIRLGAVQIAEDAGFEVLEAANADEAIEILEHRRSTETRRACLRS